MNLYCRSSRVRHSFLAVGLLTALMAPQRTAAQHPNHPLGFAPERAYESGPVGIDTVDLFSGSLSVTLPIGPFALAYNSNVWRYTTVIEGGVEKIRAEPDRLDTGGLGWHLTWGEVYHPSHWYNDTGQWLYVDEAGGRHVFYSQLHRFEDDGDHDVYYSRDNSYLRLKVAANNCSADIEAPGGTTRRFVAPTCGGGTTYRLTKVWSAFASAASPDLSITYDADDYLRTVTDRYGRVHYVHLTDELGGNPIAWLPRIVTQVDVENVGGQRLFYDFTYANIHVDVSCKDTSASTPARIKVPHLTRVDMPDGTAYSFEQAGAPLYYNNCASGIDDVSGVLKGADLPTGGKIRWDFQEYEFPPGGTNSVFNTTAGVATRRLLEPDDSEHGRWTYRTTGIGAANGNDPEMHTEVVSPSGTCSKHFFNARYWVTPSQGRGWEYALPFVYTESNAGRYLSSQIWSGNAGGACSGTKLRSSYVRFRRDQTPGNASEPLSTWYDTNRTAEATRTVYHDDGDRWTDSEMTEFDGLGHFRRTVTTGNFWGGSAHDERRETFVEYDRSTGVYPGTYVPVTPSEPWVLGVFSSVETTEPDAHGEATSRVEVGYEDQNGFRHCVRVLQSGSTRSADDVLTTLTRDSLGNIIEARRYGGDLQTLATGGPDCGSVPGLPAYWQTHEYQYGVLTRVRRRNPQGGGFAFYDVDRDIDPSTGAVLTDRDPSGFAVSYSYDSAGRLETVTPQEGAVTVFEFTNASGSTPAKMRTSRYPSAGGAALDRVELVLDAFGRLRLERRRLPGGVWSERETSRDAQGRTLSVSQWGDLAQRTQFLSFDAFGRPQVIRPPDGSAHDVLVTYAGNRAVTRQEKVAQAGGETYASTLRVRDRYGRLRRVDEPVGPGGVVSPTTYAYDVGDRLTRIVIGPTGQQQVRSMVYDSLGFLRSETHPESGFNGNGTILYRDFDAAGRHHRLTDDARDMGLLYDFLGRKTEVRDHLEGDRLVVRRVYDGAQGRGEGKLWYSDRFNYRKAGSPLIDQVRVRQIYRYHGLQGAVSKKTTKIFWSLPNVSFAQDYTYNELLDLASVSYPTCAGAACDSTMTSSQTVTYGYQEGLPVSVGGFVSAVTYHPSGVWKAIHHTNGVVDRQDVGSDFTGRAERLYSPGTSLDTGTFSFDGAGNVKAMGQDTFVYDPASRLVQANLLGFNEQYTYDRFGNLTQRAYGPDNTVDTATDPATNRLLDGSATYDGSGNLASWGTHTFHYDTNNRLVNQAWLRYAYDADGERILSIPDTGMAIPTVQFTLRDMADRLVTKVTLDQGLYSRTRDYIYGAGRLVAAVGNGAASTVDHFHLDHLGTPRVITDSSGAPKEEQWLMPYGTEIPSNSLYENLTFTGHERDFSTGNDYMHARHYRSDIGRFQSMDPAFGNPAKPQTRYAYVLGNPMRYSDPTGLGPWDWVRSLFNRDDSVHDIGAGDVITVVGRRAQLPYILPGFPVLGGNRDLTPGGSERFFGDDNPGDPGVWSGGEPESDDAHDATDDSDQHVDMKAAEEFIIAILFQTHLRHYLMEAPIMTLYRYVIIPITYWGSFVVSGITAAVMDIFVVGYGIFVPGIFDHLAESGYPGMTPITDANADAWRRGYERYQKLQTQWTLRDIWTYDGPGSGH